VSERRPLVISASTFSVTFGLAGLAGCWHLAAVFLGAPAAVAGIITIICLAVWLLFVIGSVRRLVTQRTTVGAELSHPTTAPFVALIPLTLLALIPVMAYWSPAGATVVALISMAATVLLGGWLTGTWLGRGVPETSLHSGYYLPTVAAGLIAGSALAAVGRHNLGIAAVGLGGICWLLLGSIINSRNIIADALPPALAPTMAIDVAPVVVAGNAWFALNDGAVDNAQLLLGGFAVLMVLVQVRLYLLVYRHLTFSVSFWAFVFSYCAVASYALRWLDTTDEAWAVTVSWALVAVMSTFVLWLTVRTLVSLQRGTLLPREEPVRSVVN
jgi:tellurite resistance protein